MFDMKKMLLISGTIPCLLTACTTMVEGTDRIQHIAKDNVYHLEQKFYEWGTYHPPRPHEPFPIADNYCYRVMQDHVCYEHPVPGWESRLIAYQGLTDNPPYVTPQGVVRSVLVGQYAPRPHPLTTQPEPEGLIEVVAVDRDEVTAPVPLIAPIKPITLESMEYHEKEEPVELQPLPEVKEVLPPK